MIAALHLTRARWTFVDAMGNFADRGEPVLLLNFREEPPTRVWYEQKPLFYGVEAVLLGDEWDDLLPPVTMPPLAGSKESRIWTGTTADPTIVRLTKDFRAAVDAGTFETREIPLAS